MKPSPAYQRKLANDLRTTAHLRNDDETDLALAYADTLTAQADLEDATAGEETGIADSASHEQIVPILGRLTFTGGVITAVENEWTSVHDAAAGKLGVMVAFQWCRSLHTPDAGHCQFIYIGTREAGPLAQWSAHDGHWRRCQSKGNFGKKWAFGGNWSDPTFSLAPQEGISPPAGATRIRNSYVFDSLESCRPEINQIIQNIMQQEQRIRIAKAKLEAAKLRQRAAQIRQHSAGYRRQATHPIYDGQEFVCEGKAAVSDTYADQFDARAELVLAEAGA